MNEIDFKGKLSSFMKINTISHLIYDLTMAKYPIKYSFHEPTYSIVYVLLNTFLTYYDT